MGVLNKVLSLPNKAHVVLSKLSLMLLYEYWSCEFMLAVVISWYVNNGECDQLPGVWWNDTRIGEYFGGFTGCLQCLADHESQRCV